MPKIGMASSGMVMANWLDALKAAAENNFDAFEITCVFPSANPQDIEPEAIAEAREILKSSGMEVCVHAPFFEINIAAYCRSIREVSIRLINEAADLCHALDGTVLVVHSGNYTYSLADATRHNHPAMEIQWNSNIDALKRINAHANAKDVTVCLENIAIDESAIDRSFADLLEIREKVGDSLRFTLDMGHSRLSGGTANGIQALGKAIRHIHLTDNYGKKDDHLPLGDGDYDYSEFIDFLKNFDHIITLEVIGIGTDPEPVLRARQAFQDLLTARPVP